MTKVSLDKAFDSAKVLMSYDSFLIFKEYAVSYFTTTENISLYLDRESYNKDKVLTVLGSGDQTFSLISKGFRSIDTFDINKLEYYVYYLKKAMIKRLEFETYLKVCERFTYLSFFDELKELLKKLKDYMPEDVYEYFRMLFEYIEKEENKDLLDLYYETREGDLRAVIPYLRSEETYLDLRKIIDEVEVNMYFGDARSISSELNNKYDLILLSNIADYLGSSSNPLTYENFYKFLLKFYRLLKDNGLIINYLYGIKSDFVINDSLITKENLGLNNLVVCKDKNGGILEEGYFRVRKRG